ncbi:zeta toxin family protein [Moorella sp. Hama-1]|uniref:ATP-binding protein n=1 Tax=Moorella sp. Hama-1 TaxID=2138101 RepID=UPI000D64FA76|nr:zeta toxin family protein [Moorella sp. Hama-1]BCV21686.1 nitrogenase reductase [Moorella sp. Hama-1]
MPKILITGRGGCGKSTLVTLLTRSLNKRGNVLVLDADESNLGICNMLGLQPPEMTLMGVLGGRSKIKVKLLSSPDEEKRVFVDNLTIDKLPEECLGGRWPVRYLRIGKIERSLEGCACPMGAVARTLLKELTVGPDEWVLIDTEAGVEHFGRGVPQGVDRVIIVVDPSQEALLLAIKARKLCADLNKDYKVVINKADAAAAAYLRQELAARGMAVAVTIPFLNKIQQANMLGEALTANMGGNEVEALVKMLEE